MEELSVIISIISEHTGVGKAEIIDGMSRSSTLARDITCHIIREGFPHLINPLQTMVGFSAAAFYKAANRALRHIEKDDKVLCIVNEIRRRLVMPVIKSAQKPKIPASLQLFGFKWTEIDNLKRQRAMKSASRYMDRYCSYGRQPVEDGMVRTRRRINQN